MKFEEVLPKLREGYKAKPKRTGVWLYLEDGHFIQEPVTPHSNKIVHSLAYYYILDETWEIKERKEFTKEEIDVLRKFYDLGLRYICRDGCGDVYLYETEPCKDSNHSCWVKKGEICFETNDFSKCVDLKFEPIQWEDEEPTEIADIIGVKENVKD